MNLVIHLFKKDLFRTRFLVGFWFALIIVQVSLFGVNPQPGDLILSWSLPIAGLVLATINSILVLLMIPLLVHQEPLVGTKAFWFTRPISRGALISSKAIYVLLLVSLPILIKCIGFFAHGVTFHDLLLAVPQLVIQESTWILMVAAVAVLTPNFARFAIVGAVIGVVWYVCSFTLQMYFVLSNPLYALNALSTKGMSRMLTASLVTIVFALAVIFVQYLTRRTKVAIALIVLGATLTLSAKYLWPWDYLKGGAVVAKDARFKDPDFKEDQIGVKLSGNITVTDQLGFRGGAPLKQVQGTIAFPGLPHQLFARVDSIRSEVKTTGGEQIPIKPAQNLTAGMEKAQAPLEAAIGDISIYELDSYSLPGGLFALTSDTFSKYSESPLNFSATVKCTAYKYQITNELPLTKGFRSSDGSEHLLINEILTKPNGVDVLIDIQRLNLLFGPHPEESGMPDLLHQKSVYLLVNRKLKQAVAKTSNFSFYPMQLMQNGGILQNEPLTLSFGGDDNRGGLYPYRPKLDQQWLKDAVVVKLDPVPIASFERKLEVPGFKIDGKFSLPYFSERKKISPIDFSKIILPSNATREQIKTYISQVLATLSGNKGVSQKDPRTGMLEKVGAPNVDLLVGEAVNQRIHYLNLAINALAQPENKDQIIKACSSNPDLMETVISHGWQADAKPLLLGILENPAEFRPPSWIAGIVSFNDPSTYEGLKNYYAEHPDDLVMNELKKIQGFDIAGAIDLAWKKAQTDLIPQYGQLLVPAVELGEPGVLDVASSILRGNDNYLKEQAKKAFETYTPVPGEKNPVIFQNGISVPTRPRYLEIATWYDQNKGNLIYDSQDKKFVLTSGSVSSGAPYTFLPSTSRTNSTKEPVVQSSATPAPSDQPSVTNISTPPLTTNSPSLSSIGASSNAISTFDMPTIYSMKELGRQAAAGDTSAIDQIDAIREKISEGVTYNQNRDRFIQNGELIKAALNETAKSIKGQDSSDPAFKALIYAAAKQNLGGYAAGAFGIAAALGNQPSLDVLLNYPEHGLILSGVVPALSKSAEMGNPKAIEFLVKVIDDDSSKPLWYMASRGLFMPANQGNPEAKRAIARYSEYEKQRNGKSSSTTPTVIPSHSTNATQTDDEKIILAMAVLQTGLLQLGASIPVILTSV